MQRTSVLPANRRAAFTLVELVTVIAILSILMTLTVGAVQAIQNSMARTATQEMFRGLEAGLNSFYREWNKYPWYVETSVTITGTTTGNTTIKMGDPNPYTGKEFIKPPTTLTNEQKAQYALYHGLSAISGPSNITAGAPNRWGRGTYFPGGGGATAAVPLSAGSFQAYADGWGRAILYDLPVSPHTVPKLTSRGFKGADAQAADMIENYKY